MPSKPQIHEPRALPGSFLHLIGLALMAANKLRRTFRPYDRPRPWSGDQVERSVQYVLDVARNWETGFREAGLGDWLRGRSVLELGPGPDLGTGLVMIARGARRYLAVDRFALLRTTPPAFYDALLERLAGEPDVERAREAYRAFRHEEPGSDLQYKLLTSEADPGRVGPGSADPRSVGTDSGSDRVGWDLWVSQATLEHLDDPPTVLRLLTSWCKPGALALHHVDAATHTPWIRDADPLNILRYPERLYRALSFPGSPNRWRSGSFVACFSSLGWDVLDCQPVHRLSDPSLARVRPGIASPYRSLADDELGVYSFRLVLRKSGIPHPERIQSDRIRSTTGSPE